MILIWCIIKKCIENAVMSRTCIYMRYFFTHTDFSHTVLHSMGGGGLYCRELFTFTVFNNEIFCDDNNYIHF